MKNQTNLLNPTPKQIKDRNRLWANALLKNKRKARGQMYDEHGGRCCLAVAQDVAISCGVTLKNPNDKVGLPDDNVRRFFGWGSRNPELQFENNGVKNSSVASKINDGGWIRNNRFRITNAKIIKSGFSHKQIAQFVLDNFVEP